MAVVCWRCFILLYIHNPAPTIIAKMIKPTKIGASNSTRNTTIAIFTTKRQKIIYIELLWFPLLPIIAINPLLQ